MPAPLIFAISGAAQLGLGAWQLAEANKRRRAAQAAYERSMQQYRAQDTSNLYANLENPYEDLTVNQQAGMADMMSRFQETSQGGDISAFAQVLANQQAQNLQRASASISQQEAANQRMAAQGAMRIEGMERMGAERARDFKGNILGTELGMNMQTLAGAEAARNQAMTNIAGGAGNLAAGGVGMYQNYMGNTIDMGDGVQFASTTTAPNYSAAANVPAEFIVQDANGMLIDTRTGRVIE
jgi:hypothetical protein